MNVSRTERGWPGHYIKVADCRFRRNTLLEYRDEKVVVSTVGLRIEGTEIVTIANGIFYETMCFYAKEYDVFNDANVSKKIHVDGKWYVSQIEGEIEANQMHEDIVDEISAKMIIKSIVLEADYEI